jgi:hypothetical protein
LARWTDPTIVASTAFTAHADVSADPNHTRPPRVGWVPVGGYRVPVSATLGPADLADGLARGFARTPAGAVIAAANIAARATPQAGSRVFGPTIYRQVFDPKGDAFARAVAARYQRARSRTRIPDGDPLFAPRPLTVVGYRIAELNPGEPDGARSLTGVRLHLLLQSPGGGYRDMRLQVRWLPSNWLLYPPPRDDWARVTKTVCPRPGGYVRFRP